MTDRAKPEPQSPALLSGLLVIFGITGDLAKRYLLPALYQLDQLGILPKDFEIIGATRHGIEISKLMDELTAELKSSGAPIDQTTLDRLQARLKIIIMDPTKASDYIELKRLLDQRENDHNSCMNRLFYLSIPPQIYSPVVDQLGASGLATGCQHGTADSRIMVEKPFGYDLASAKELIDCLRRSFDESQIYRVDHYLAKETAQNILTFRFANPIFQAVWNRHHISSIDITASETIGIEGRTAFYETVGALRDFVQNHLLQLLAITTMELPSKLDTSHIHAAKLKLLDAIKPIAPNQVETAAMRGQYKGYKQEVKNPDSSTETFARLHLFIQNATWENVPITLQTGKQLDRRSTEITLTFGPANAHDTANTLTFRIQPNEGIAIELLAKEPGLSDETKQVEMAFNYQSSFGSTTPPGAYERVLADGIRGDQTLFTSSDEVLASWRIVEAVVKEWSKSPAGLVIYEPGTPAKSIA